MKRRNTRGQPREIIETRVGAKEDPDVRSARRSFRRAMDLPPKVPEWDSASPLNELLKPLTLRQFADRHRGRAPALFEGPSDRFAAYFSLLQLRDLLSRRSMPPHHVRLHDEHQRERRVAFPPDGIDFFTLIPH